MAKSSINIQIATIFALLHNLRVAIVSYTIAKSDRNDCNRSVEEAYSYYLALVKEAISNYTSRTRQQLQTNEKKFLWEAVINLNANHTLEDLEALAVVLEKKYGWRSIQNSIHRDEGHIDLKSGEKIYNYHGHMVLFMLDNGGIYRFKKRDFGIKRMEELQTLTAEVLKMERGISKKITKKVRLDHRQHRQVQKEKEQLEVRIQDLISEVHGMHNQYNILLDRSVNELTELENLYDKLEEENKILKQQLTDLVAAQKDLNYSMSIIPRR